MTICLKDDRATKDTKVAYMWFLVGGKTEWCGCGARVVLEIFERNDVMNKVDIVKCIVKEFPVELCVKKQHCYESDKGEKYVCF